MTKRTNFLKDSPFLSQDRAISPWWRNVTIFAVGLLVGWLIFGWVLFPVKYTQVYPNELRPEALNDYLLMTAESYGATHDLRTAGKRLRYWDDPNVLGPMLNDLAQSIETSNPAGAAYLQILAQDLHLPATPTAPTTSRPASRPSSSFNFLWLLIPLLALAVLAALIIIAQRFGLLGQRQPSPQIETPVEPPTPVGPIEDADFSDAPGAVVSPDLMAEPDDFFEDDDLVSPPLMPGPDEPVPLPQDSFPDITPDDEEEEAYAPITDQMDEPDVDAEPETPETLSAPLPPPLDEVEDDVELEINHPDVEDAPIKTQVLRFNGDPAYNTIIAIEPNDDYLGEYGLSAGQTAPNNPNLALTLEVWLFDKSDTQTTEIVLASPVIVTDPDLKARYVRENTAVLPLREGQAIALETAELRLQGRVRKVTFGAATSDGAPVIEHAEIELSGQRK